jgi:hypothetical protein
LRQSEKIFFIGVGQCIAAIVAAQIFEAEQHHNKDLNCFMESLQLALTGGLLARTRSSRIDAVEYYISEVDRILGILLEPLRSASQLAKI